MSSRLENFLNESTRKIDLDRVSLQDELTLGDLGPLAADIVIAELRRYRLVSRAAYHRWYQNGGHKQEKQTVKTEVDDLRKSIDNLQKQHTELLKSDSESATEMEQNYRRVKALEVEILAAEQTLKKERIKLQTFDNRLAESRTRLDIIEGQIADLPPSVFSLELGDETNGYDS